MPLAEVLMLAFLLIFVIGLVAGVVVVFRIIRRSVAEHRQEIARRSRRL